MLSDKKLEKIEKTLGDETVSTLIGLSPEELKLRVLVAEVGMKEAQDELDANEEYQALKESKKDMEAALKDVNKRQKAVIAYSLHLLEGKGQ